MSRCARRWLSLGGVFALLFAVRAADAEGNDGPHAPASESVAAQPLERARVRYHEGVEAFNEGRFRDAIDLFLEADQLAPSAALSFNIGTAYEKLEKPAAALRWYRDYLRRAPDAADRTKVESIIAEFEHTLQDKGVQQITVMSTPAGATLVIDGKPAGVTPWTGEIAPGGHALALSLEGREPATRSVDLPPDHALDVDVDLAPAAPAPAPAPPSPAMRPAPARPVTAPTHPSEPGHGKMLTTLGWVGVAAGGAALGGALVFELLRQSAESDAKSDRTQIGYADKLDTMYGRQTAARVLLGVGGALAATGGVLLFLGRGHSHTGSTALGLLCGPGGCACSVRGRF